MREQGKTLADFGIHGQRVVATEYGIQVLSERPELAAAVADFSWRPGNVLSTFEGFDAIDGDQAGETMSAVYEIGNLVIKVSTEKTVDRRFASAERPLRPENCVLQFHLLNALRHYFRSSRDARITSPSQYIAVEADDSSSLVVMEKLTDMVRLDEWLLAAAQAGLDITDAPDLVIARIRAAVSDSAFEPAIADLFRPGELDYTDHPTIARFRADNIMVRKRPTRDILGYLKFCTTALIDLPAPFAGDVEATTEALETYTEDTGYSPEYITS